jgi:large subunit ribosomal protein L1
MPSPKVGTVTFDIFNAVREQKAGKVDFRVEKAGIVHAPLGKISFGTEKLRENLIALLDNLLRLKPSTSKGVYLRKASISLSQSPGLRLDVSELQTIVRG